jgi:uncharacterized protein
MKKIRLGKTGLRVTRLGFGGIPIQRLEEKEAISVIQRCLDLGINYFDTAQAYTTSEARVGKAIQGQREKVILATKSTSRNPEEIQEHLELSLRNLQTDYIDLYQFHAVNDLDNLDKVLDPKGVMAVIKKAQAHGRVRHIGISCHQIDVAKKAVQTGQFETVMFPFNFVAPEAADQIFPLCHQYDVGFIGMKPLAGGIIEQASLAFKYLFQFPDILPIPGVQKIAEIEEIVKILENPEPLSRTEQREMERIRQSLGSKFCHRCDYCQPCSQGILISTVMTTSSLFKRLPPERFFSPFVSGPLEKAVQCSRCGECEKRCPYRLPIREMIAEQVSWYQGLAARYREQKAG